MGKFSTMSTGLNAVYEELLRLQKEGVDRVYINEQTSDLLQPVKAALDAPLIEPKKEPTGVDLRDLVKDGDATTSSTPPAAAPHPAPSSFKPIPTEAPSFELPAGDAQSRMKWLKDKVEACTVCREHLGESGKIVFGTGPADADIFICGDAPGADEALVGLPFVDNSGELLSKIITAMGVQREAVYLTTALKWRPEHETPYGSRPPNSGELQFCLPYLRAQLEIVQPKVVIALGRAVVSALFGEAEAKSFGRLRGHWKTFEGFPVMVTFNPSYLLQNDTLKTKRMAWEDLLQVMYKLDLPISEKQRGFFLPKK